LFQQLVMKMKKKNLVFLLVLFLVYAPVRTLAQDISGVWRGYFVSSYGEEYRLEFQLKKAATGTSVQGVSYSYLDKRFYGKATMTGWHKTGNNSFQISELRTVEVKNMGGGGTCLMKYQLTYEKSGKEEFLVGTYIGKTEDRENPKNNGVWGDCGGGTVRLRRTVQSEFALEPFMRKVPMAPDPRDRKPVTAKTNPQPKPPVTTKPPVVTKPKTNPPVVVKNNPVPKPKTDTVSRMKNPPVAKIDPPVTNPVIKPKTIVTTIPAVLKNRENELAKTLVVNSENIIVRLYDNGEIDDDTISVYLDKKLVLSSKRLTTAPLTINLKMDADNADHELVMVAENLGRIPPNTSLMTVTDGDKRYEVRITSTEQKNAMVRFRYQKP
jgi:hypothetical protein